MVAMVIMIAVMIMAMTVVKLSMCERSLRLICSQATVKPTG